MLLKWRALAGTPATLAIISIVIIIATAFGSYLYLQTLTETSVRDALLEKQKQSQIDNANSLTNSISSDLDRITVRLEHFASITEIRESDFATDNMAQKLAQLKDEIGAITPVDTVNILDSQGTLVSIASESYGSFLGTDLSERDYSVGTKSNLDTYVSRGFDGLNGKYQLALATPITSRSNGQYLGLVVVLFPSLDFFDKYGNVNNINSQLLVAVDKDGSFLSLAPQFSRLLGVNFYSDEVQKTNNGNPDIYKLYHDSVRLGKFSYGTFDTGVGERFAVMSPVYFNGAQVMTVVYTIPTAVIYSQVDSLLATERLQTSILLAAVLAAICLLIIYLSRWNKTLQRTVNARTEELGILNSELTAKTAQLQDANEQLTLHDRLQKEFINVAAHELRTPIQPILGATELLEQQFLEGKQEEAKITRAEVDLLVRNAKRLERLSSDVLQVTRIESNNLVLEKERMNLNDKIRNVIRDFDSLIIATTHNKGKTRIIFEPKTDPIELEIDKSKIYEVISNLLRNAIKFTEEGTILVTSETLTTHAEKPNETFALVKIRDTGTGIDSEIFPKLFSKFATKSEQGTGLGLFISKSIVEAHGGKIWAENNSDGKGATFSFTLPQIRNESVPI